MHWVWGVLVAAFAILAAALLDSYIGISSILRSKPKVVSAAAA